MPNTKPQTVVDVTLVRHLIKYDQELPGSRGVRFSGLISIYYRKEYSQEVLEAQLRKFLNDDSVLVTLFATEVVRHHVAIAPADCPPVAPDPTSRV